MGYRIIVVPSVEFSLGIRGIKDRSDGMGYAACRRLEIKNLEFK